MFSFGAPPDAVAWAALIVGLSLLVLPFRRISSLPPRFAVPALALLAGALSCGYFRYYLGGEPRVIDATAYLLEARSFAAGGFSFLVPSPTASFRGRFLISTAENDHALAVIFPPGYPALLALGVLVGKVEWMGPLLGGALVAATHGLTKSLTNNDRTALYAALLSALNACLRYHTAETMSHGWSALLATSALWATVQLLRDGVRWRWVAFLGGSLGFLVATRQLTGVLIALCCFVPLAVHLWAQKPRTSFRISQPTASASSSVPASSSKNDGWLLMATFLLSALPGVSLLLSHHLAITGSFFESPQTRYYDLADGPGSCFGWGLGHGCGYEHADVVQEQGGSGLTWKWALLNTLHRVHWHALDVANFEPLLLIGLLAAWKVRRHLVWWPLLSAIPVVVIGYAFFYFNGSYPGGGARFFSELIPSWHALIACGIAALRAPRPAFFSCLLGFALHGVYSHRLLESEHFGPSSSSLSTFLSEGPRPAAHDAPIPLAADSVVFVSSAHAFNLGALRTPLVRVARNTQDSRVWFLTREAQGASFVFEPEAPAASFEPLLKAPPPRRFVLESEVDYPPLFARHVWVHPSALALSCVSGGRALEVHVDGPRPELVLELLPMQRGIDRPPRLELQWVETHSVCRRRSIPAPLEGERLLLRLEEFTGLTHLDAVTWTSPE